MNITLRICLALLISISSILLVVGYLGGFSTPDLIPRTLSLSKPSAEPSPTSAGLTINLPAIVAPVDDGARFYYVQANLAVEIDRPATATIIRERHDQIDRYIMEMLHTYPVQDLRVPGQSVTLREDLKRTVNKLLPKGKGQVRNVYITNWLMTPVGS
ncbi:MAG TPA: flagellar basal body-associated FliL family protein [Nitrospira sp.]|jgi:flagellar basal body-associated protein FliL|nr:flagellar basal body-associated FliL family protein [Nitrospira sp.]MBS0162930.1 flagellar basal body-associated FliL family protein [Nitrospira sp.]MBS0176003.1 flagellar basal body-associated FliL family protein [Nitrospira sp.]MBS0178102.1 flagellar basal body-associated FliL family protein [Nitrospira sp.]MBX3337432.1 flagellar basal body-associated FliL family protein [Nitrospira sp.]